MRKRFLVMAAMIFTVCVAAVAVQAAASTSSEVEEFLKQGAAKMQAKDFNGAIEVYKKVVAVDPENYTAYHNMGLCFMALQKWTEMITALQKAQIIDPLKGEDAFLLGMAYASTGNFEMAVVKFRRALQFDYDQPAVYQALVASYLRQGKTSDALVAANEAVTAYPDNPMVWFILGNVNAVSGSTNKAISAFEKVIKLDAKAVEAYNALASQYCLLDKYEDAAVVLKKANEIAAESNFENVEGYILLSTVHFEMNKMDESVLAARRALELAPKSPEAMANLGFIYAERGERLKEALDLCTKAADIMPKSSSLLDSLGWVQYKNGHVDDAIATLLNAQKLDPGDAWVHYHLAAIYLAQKKKDKAVEQYRLAEKCTSYSRKLKSGMVQLRKQLGL